MASKSCVLAVLTCPVDHPWKECGREQISRGVASSVKTNHACAADMMASAIGDRSEGDGAAIATIPFDRVDGEKYRRCFKAARWGEDLLVTRQRTT